jgi:Acetyl-CoA carboxylase, central region
MVIIILTDLRTPSTEILRELTDSRYTVFDVLPAFFANEDPWVTLGRLFFFWLDGVIP